MRNIIKRDGTVRPYEPEKIITAMGKAFRETAAGTSREEMERLLRAVEKEMEHKDGGWAVEDIQDAVERVLMENGRYEEAKRYILYRHRRNEQRAARRAMAQAAGVSPGRALPHTSFKMKLCVSTLPTFFASRHSSLYSMGVRCTSCPAR